MLFLVGQQCGVTKYCSYKHFTKHLVCNSKEDTNALWISAENRTPQKELGLATAAHDLRHPIQAMGYYFRPNSVRKSSGGARRKPNEFTRAARGDSQHHKRIYQHGIFGVEEAVGKAELLDTKTELGEVHGDGEEHDADDGRFWTPVVFPLYVA